MCSSGFWKDKTIVVSGATGFVASNLAAKLLRQGAKSVVGISRDVKEPLPGFQWVWQRMTMVWGSICDACFVSRVVRQYKPDVVFHLAAQTEVGLSLYEPELTFYSNVVGTFNVLEAVRQCAEWVKALVIWSSDKAYGAADQLPYVETMPLARVGDWYSISKSMADYCSQQYARLYDLPIRVLRPANTFGPGQRNETTLITGTVCRLQRGDPVGVRTGREKVLREYVYVDDVVRAGLQIAEDVIVNHHSNVPPLADPGAVCFNVGSGERRTSYEVVKMVLDLMGADDQKIGVDPPQNGVQEIADQSLDSGKLARLLPDWRATSLKDGMKMTIDWYKKVYRHR